MFSGPIAASAFTRFLPDRDRIRRIILIGPAHYVRVQSLAAPVWSAFATPLGVVPVDAAEVAGLHSLRHVIFSNQPHAPEHCLEVELPFLQVVLEQFSIVPLLVGGATIGEVAAALEQLWGGPETRIVVSSDLSHFHDCQTARRLDADTARAITELKPEALGEESACGRIPIKGLLEVARKRSLRPRLLDLRNSGETAGPRQGVVGYGAFEFD
jgi:AmmeMemoRadiSam system protein B